MLVLGGLRFADMWMVAVTWTGRVPMAVEVKVDANVDEGAVGRDHGAGRGGAGCADQQAFVMAGRKVCRGVRPWSLVHAGPCGSPWR